MSVDSLIVSADRIRKNAPIRDMLATNFLRNRYFSILFNRKIRKALHGSDVFVPIQVILSEIFETPVSKREKLVVKEMVKNSMREMLLEIKEKRPSERAGRYERKQVAKRATYLMKILRDVPLLRRTMFIPC